MNRTAVILPATLVIVPICLAIFGPLFAVDDMPKDAGSTLGNGHVFGTDFAGRDVWNEVLIGGRTVVIVAAAATICTYLLGVPAGLLAGMSRRRFVDELVMRPLDIALSIPSMVLLLLLASSAPDTTPVLVGIVVLINFPEVVRTTRSCALSHAYKPSVEAMWSQGEGWWHIAVGYVGRAIARTLVADMGIRFTGSIYLIASASFLGVGVSPQSNDWASMVDRNRTGMFVQPWAVLIPAMLIIALSVGVNLLADRVFRGMESKWGVGDE